jgi:hypothetical protein
MKKINVKNLIYIEYTNTAYVDAKEALEYHEYEETVTYKNAEGCITVIYQGREVAYIHDIKTITYIYI